MNKKRNIADLVRLVAVAGSLVLSAGTYAQKAPEAEKPAAAPPKPETVLDLQDGDTFVFLGDSITHQCLYTQYVEDFFYTRYPDRKIHFHNAGVSGDRAADALRRFDADVAAFKPKYVSVLLGMNDGEYQNFNSETFGLYEKGMTEILGRIREIGAAPIVMSPTMFDHHQLAIRKQEEDFRFGDRPFDPYYNSVLAYYGAWLREQAGEQGLPFVNLWAPTNDYTTLQRRTEPDFTLVPDAIHPGPGGQFIMAYEMISQLGTERKNVSSITVVNRGGAWKGNASGGELSEVKGSPEADHVTFTFAAQALPWVVPDEAFGEGASKWEDYPKPSVGAALTKAGHHWSNERVKIVGLEPGTYEVLIDGQSAGKKFSHVSLGAKIELQSNPATPQYQQAMEVALLNRERNDMAVRMLRNRWSHIKGVRNRYAEAAEPDPVKLEEDIAKAMSDIEELIKLADDYEARIWELAQPKARTYEIRKVD